MLAPFLGVDASQSLSVWWEKGWIHLDDGTAGYFMGCRISEEDRRQINRWKAMRRHFRQVEINCEKGDLGCRKRQRQALLHWAYDSRKL